MTDLYAYCPNTACRMHAEVQMVLIPEYKGGRLWNSCRSCGTRLREIGEEELREFREARNRLQGGSP